MGQLRKWTLFFCNVASSSNINCFTLTFGLSLTPVKPFSGSGELTTISFFTAYACYKSLSNELSQNWVQMVSTHTKSI